MDQFYDEVQEPVSPHGHYFNSSVICSYVFGFLEMAVPIDDSQTIPLLEDVFLPINPRFSSIMVRDQAGKMRWKRVQVNPEEHVKVPRFPECNSAELYEQYFDDYVTRILNERTPQNKPLWEIHLIKYPTSSAAGTIIFKFHHSLGDGYSLMGALLSCLQRTDDPSLPLTFPSNSQHAKKNMFKLHSVISSLFSSMLDFGSSIIKTRMIEDDKTPIRSGYEGTKPKYFTLSNISLSLDHIKAIKSNLGVEMQKPKVQGLWGNKISFLQIPIPKLSQSKISNPLEFVWNARKLIKRKRHSFSVYLIGLLLDLEMKLRGPEVASKTFYNTLGNCSVLISNMFGPMEQMALANHPVSGVYFAMSGGPQNVNVEIMSYVGELRITSKTLKGFIDEQKFKFCIEKAFDEIFKDAMEIYEIPKWDIYMEILISGGAV
ncbi:hypothetical protein JHK82_033453 [Glycine max]|nr:hypothetical protein JHK85_034175 [Glycine max]KAG4985853.1 hypothetical protein JHK86_033544 [Glycine max]KAG5119033.1 hypothetical protein JHK82_033453 [Glycine max]KAG5140026.1 hypothetical protein JHK84_033794 [Glycine max]